MKKTLVFIAVFIAGCGGGGGSTDNQLGAEQLFDDYRASQQGGYRSLGTAITDGSLSASNGCGYTEIATYDEVLAEVRSAGGTVSESSADRFCASSTDEESCLVRVGGSLVLETIYKSPTVFETEIIIPGLRGNRRAYFYLLSDGSLAFNDADIETPDSSVSTSGSCSPSTPNHPASAINGQWEGFSVTYVATANSGTELARTMTCASQSCSISGRSGALPFSSFNALGTWHAKPSGTVAGAAISSDANALTLYVCPAPLTEADALAQCEFFGFSRI